MSTTATARPADLDTADLDTAARLADRPAARLAAPSPTQPEQVTSQPEQAPSSEQPLQDMGRPGILARPAMRWHPSLMQLAIGAALVAALLGACNVAAINAHREARAYCRALVVSDWDRAQRECRGTGAGTPVPEQAGTSAPAAPSTEQGPGMSGQTQAAPDAATLSPMSGQTPDARSGTQPDWVTSDTRAPYDRTDPSASPLSLPRCTTSPTTPMPCLAHVSADRAHAVVLEEDASLTALARR